MPGMRLNLNEVDKSAMKFFFTERTYKPENASFMKLSDSWKSTNEINQELDESWVRTQKRLEKLAGFGLVDHQWIRYGERRDHYWYISRDGVYCILSTLDSVNFL